MKHVLVLFFLFSLATLSFTGCMPVSAETPAGAPAQSPQSTNIVIPVTSSGSTTSSGRAAAAPLVPSINLEYQAAARAIQGETIAAVPPDPDTAWFDQFPQHLQLTLQDYLLQNSLYKAQIFIYPLKDLAAYPGPAKAVNGLHSLLEDKQIAQQLPCLPFYYNQQVFHPQLQFLDFRSGHGVRYVTQFSQAHYPVINNQELIYTYQGITADGRYYVSAVLPVNQPGLPINATASPDIADQAQVDPSGYLTDVTSQLGNASPASFTPDLKELDALMQSLKIN
jgi:hypothetical protein